MLWTIVLLLLGFILLIKGADWFVDSASSLAFRYRIPAHIVGMTIIAFGTSAPELSVSLTAAIKGSGGIAIGNVVGSCLINLLIVAGISATIRPMPINRSILSKNYPYSVVGALVLFILSYDMLFESKKNVLSQGDGLILLIFFCIFIYFTMSETKQNAKQQKEDSKEWKESLDLHPKGTLKNIFFILLGLFGIVGGGQLIVAQAVIIANSAGINEGLIGLSIVAIGTSLPEAVTSIVAVKKGNSDIALSNVIGSNIYNIFLILGLSASIAPIAVDMDSIVDAAILCASSMIFYIPMFFLKKVSRSMGILMITVYSGYLAYSIIYRLHLFAG